MFGTFQSCNYHTQDNLSSGNFSLQNATPLLKSHIHARTQSQRYTKKRETVLLWHLWHGPLIDRNDRGESWHIARVWWRVHWWSSGCRSWFFVLPDLHACVGQSRKFPYHLVYTFNKSLVLISTITNPHIKGIIILVYKCFNDKK